MKKLLLLLFPATLVLATLSQSHLDTLYRSLDPQSIAQLLAFYHLYPETDQGQRALSDTWKLIHKHRNTRSEVENKLVLPAMDIDGIISFVNKQPSETEIELSQQQLTVIESISDHLPHRQLKGHSVWKKSELFPLSAEEIDLSRALFLCQFEEDPWKIRQYEASLDLIALQILARLPLKATDEEKIRAINHFIFHEKRFRFPPHSLHAKDIDTYTFLSSVLDSRLGVCLGVSILYLTIAERLDLPLEIITPPGHIYIRYRNKEYVQNIETTARGIHLPDRTYLGINNRALQKRTKKEVIGLAFINQASVAWRKEDYQTAIELYEQARFFLPDDPLLKMLLGYNYLFMGKEKKGRALLHEIKDQIFDHAIAKETTPEDYLNGKVNIEGIKALFLHVDETRESILKKQKKIAHVLETYPDFRAGILQLAITQLQLGQSKHALKNLSRLHLLDPNSPVVEYYLSIVLLDRFFYKKAWEHLHRAEEITKRKNHFPHCLKELRHTLRSVFPDPADY